MHLSKQDEKAVDGEFGSSLSIAYKILLAIGEATEAEKLVRIKWAHVSGVNYNTIGDAGLEFLTEFSKDARVSVQTTLNPMGFDKDMKSNISQEFRSKQTTIVESYMQMGIVPSFTCIPYEIFELPQKGTSVSFAESNAAIMANSVYGLLTNKESALSALASAITGKAPYSELHNVELRHPKAQVKVDVMLSNELDYGLLGYFTGNAISKSCVSLGCHGKDLDIAKAKSLSAALGTSGSCAMFTPEELNCETIRFGKKEMVNVRDELNTTDRGDVIALGSPQLGMNELKFISESVEGKKFSKPCMIFCPRAVYNEAFSLGIAQQIENAGGNLICDACTCLTPLITKDEYDGVITNSVKGSYYFSKSNRVPVCLKDLRTILKEHLK
ncbi:MAG: aconitase X catalytic domain-containing protein [Thermoproteota archaeon]|nr:aconitase X catalytic domain-containing protein [Thermoproteota archaeon]